MLESLVVPVYFWAVPSKHRTRRLRRGAYDFGSMRLNGFGSLGNGAAGPCGVGGRRGVDSSGGGLEGRDVNQVDGGILLCRGRIFFVSISL